MPIIKNRMVFGVARELTAFMNLDVGFTRGEAPSPERDLLRVQKRASERERQLEEQNRRLEQSQKRLLEANRKLQVSRQPSNKKRGTDGEDRERILRMVGGMWEEMGQLQFDFLREQGLKPEHRFLDVGCGILRGGVHFIPYLESGNYYGIDKNRELLNFGRKEVEKAGLQERQPTLVQIEDFGFGRLGQTFDYALAQSVFTHLPLNYISRCLVNVDRVLETRRRVLRDLLRESWRQAAPGLDSTGRRGDLLLRQRPVPLHSWTRLSGRAKEPRSKPST